jgi:hypothetical protein
MESPLEEHSGSESGWTMYIGSAIQNENDNKSRDIHGENDGDDDDGSEDSMASDASSGPSHHELPCGKGEGSGGSMGDIIKHAKDEANSKYSSEKKPHKQKQVKKKDERRVKEDKGQSVFRAESAASQVSSGAKPRKAKMMLKEE